MELIREQIETAIGARIREYVALGADRWALVLADGERLVLQRFASGDALATAETALERLRAEIDLPVPQVQRANAASADLGGPWALFGGVAGEPLTRKLPQLSEEHLYRVGARLGQVACRVHRLAGGRYGALAGVDPCAADDEQRYLMARLEHDLDRAIALQVLTDGEAGQVRNRLLTFVPPGRQAALLIGGLAPEALLVRQQEGRWMLSGVFGWEHALSWSPAWEHVTFLDAADDPRLFSLRVGYGNGYDGETQRVYEQVREPVLRPYRVLLALRRAVECAGRNARDEAQRRKAVLIGLVR
ncbi:MAG: phosphotransferase [Chloroflexi bacterium]|nr:phosphotransferase [Chloroflexota bacterium]